MAAEKETKVIKKIPIGFSNHVDRQAKEAEDSLKLSGGRKYEANCRPK